MRRRVLVLTREMIPLAGVSTSGGGLRAWGLGEALKSRGHEVIYSMPRHLVPEGEAFDELRRYAFEPDEIHTAPLKAEADVLLIEQWGLATYLQDVAIPVVLDLHGSLILENAFREHRSFTSNAAAKIKALQKADLVLCPAVRQRAYFMSWMMMSGADPRRIPIEVIPVSMPPELPAREADVEGPLSLVYGGQLWPWIHPEEALCAAAEILDRTGAGTCHLFVESPSDQAILPHDESSLVKARFLPETLLNSGAIHVEGWLPRDTLLERYARAHLAVDVYAHNTERELAYTTRTVEYLWCGLPVLHANYGELAQLIERYQAGWVVPPDNPEVIRSSLRQAIEDREELKRRSDNAVRLVQEKLTWDQTIEPLHRFVQDPVIRDKGTTIFGRLALEFDRISDETKVRVRDLQHTVDLLHGEVDRRDKRLTDLTDQLTQQDRQFAQWADRHGRETAELDRQNRLLQAQLDRAHEEVTEVNQMLRCEQEAHIKTQAAQQRTANELTMASQTLKEQERQIDELQADLKGAVEQVNEQTSEARGRVESLETRLREESQRNLDLSRDVAERAGQLQSLQGELNRAKTNTSRLEEQIASLQQDLRQLKDTWIQRTVATGQHSLKRVAVQMPALAGLFVRNLANNTYMTLWQKKNKVRIFPGQ